MIQQLLDRRIPQLTGLYLVASWGFVQFIDWTVNRYALAPALTTLVITLLLLLVPLIVILAWRHGARGEDEWTKVDAAAIGLNLIAAAGILLATFGGQELGAATTVKLVEDADGNTVERVVPKAEFRRSVLIFPFDNESEDSSVDWLGPGVVMGVEFDLLQDVFITVLNLQDPTVKEHLDEAGLSPFDQIPLTLKRAAAQRRSLDYFLEGSFGKDGSVVVIETRLYDTRRARVVANRTYRGEDALELADRISVDLRRDLGIPDWQIDESVDLPAAELITNSPEAYRALVQGQMSFELNDFAAANARAREAIALDSTSAVAHFMEVVLALLTGDITAAAAKMPEVNRYAYRLPDRTRLLWRVLDQWYIRPDLEAAIRSARYWAEIYPQDVAAKRMLSQLYGSTGDNGQALEQSRAILEIDPANIASVRGLATHFRRNLDYDSAIVYYERLRDRLPTDVQTRLDLAVVYQNLARFSDAREQLEQAQTAAPSDPTPPTQLGFMDLQLGRYSSAIEHLEQVATLVRTPQERERMAGLEETLYYQRGQFALLEGAYRKRLEATADFRTPIERVGPIGGSEFFLYSAEWGREEQALQQIDSLSNTVGLPWSLFLERAAASIHLNVGDIDSAKESLAGIRRVGQMIGSPQFYTARATWVEGRIAELEHGSCDTALERYDEATSLDPLAPQIHVARLRCLTALERWGDAGREADWLLERHPGWGTHRLLIARYHVARGQTDEAISHLEAALGFWSDADADYIPAQEARALLEELRGL